MTFGLKSELNMVRARIATLTPREREVFELVIRGDTNKQVARALGCTERTIKAHRHRVMEKMRAQSLAELVSLAERQLPDRQSSRSLLLAKPVSVQSLIESRKKASAGRHSFAC